MARKTRTTAAPRGNPDIGARQALSPAQREAMIREAAYYRYLERGHADGHDVDDWLEAEAALDRITPEAIAPAPEEFPPDIELHQSSVHGAGKDDELKRIIRQHPQRGIPQVEGIEPEKAPLKEKGRLP